ncbi:MAG: SRPBCC family protein, partial [Sulfolobaceae archaeon]
MINFEICKEIDDREKVWDVVKDVKKIPEFWKGTRELNVEETSQGVYEGDVRFAFPSKGKVKIEIR